MTNFERPGFNQNSAFAGETAAATNPWEVSAEQLPATFAMAGGPEEIFEYYGEASQRAAAEEAEQGTNKQPAVTESTEDTIARDKRQGKKGIELLTDQLRERLNRALGGAGLRFA